MKLKPAEFESAVHSFNFHTRVNNSQIYSINFIPLAQSEHAFHLAFPLDERQVSYQQLRKFLH